MTDLTRLADSITSAARAINDPKTTDERLRAVVRTAPATVPGFDAASVSFGGRKGSIRTRASTSDLVLGLDQVQYDLGQGPCVDAVESGQTILVPSLRNERRWPGYVARANEAGITSQMAIHLGHSEDLRASLNLYSVSRVGIDPEALGIASLFATHAALALGWAQTSDQLNAALSTRKIIGQAVGIVMERYKLNEEAAFAFLIRVSTTGNIKIRDVAQELVDQLEREYASRNR